MSIDDCKINEEEKELIWVPKSYAGKYKKANDKTAQLKILEELISKQKRDIKFDLEQLDEDTIRFKASILRYKEAFTEVYEHNAAQVGKLWDDIEREKPSQEKFVKKIKTDLAPIIEEVEKLSKAIDKLNTYSLSRMVELIDKIQSCDTSTKKLLLEVIRIGIEEN